MGTLTPEQKVAAEEVRTAARALNAKVQAARDVGLDTMLAVNEPKPPLGVQSVNPVICELEEDR